MINVNRRQMLGMMGGAMAVGIGAGAVGLAAGEAKAVTTGMPVEEKMFSWTPHVLDPKEIQPVAHDQFYYKGLGCGYGVFYSIIGTLGKKYGAPYNSFPYSMMEMGKSGVSDWGTLCGALMGAISALALFWGRKDRDPMVDELFRWYETTAFPLYKPLPTAKVGLQQDIPTSVADSVLCHVSVSKWAYTTGLPAAGKERSERCARITADIAGKTVEIMNAKINGTFKGGFARSESSKYCTEACHGDNPEKVSSPILKGKMDCAPCHGGSEHVQNKWKDHP